MHQAVVDDNPQLLQQLMDEGSHTSESDAWGYSPLELARYLGRTQCFALLQKTADLRFKVLFKGTDKIQSVSKKYLEEALGFTYISNLEFDSYQTFNYLLRKCPWILSSSSLGRENRWLGSLHLQAFESGRFADVSIRWINDILCYGLFAETSMPAQALIGEYTGVVHRRVRFRHTHNDYSCHYPLSPWRFKAFMIDATKKGNFIRFVNHSDEPNLEPICLVKRSLLHFAFKTKRPIIAGEELTVDYGEGYWNTRKKFDRDSE